MSFNKDLLNILCCPESKAELVLDENFLISTDPVTRRKYRIENDIPIMLIEESEILSESDWKEIMKKYNKI